ncbi:MAG: hypothetical protein ACRDSR_26625 [Pseudonocardiaceae bacterium]
MQRPDLGEQPAEQISRHAALAAGLGAHGLGQPLRGRLGPPHQPDHTGRHAGVVDVRHDQHRELK